MMRKYIFLQSLACVASNSVLHYSIKYYISPQLTFCCVGNMVSRASSLLCACNYTRMTDSPFLFKPSEAGFVGFLFFLVWAQSQNRFSAVACNAAWGIIASYMLATESLSTVFVLAVL